MKRDLDLVEIVPNAEPPVCRIMDYGNFVFEQKKQKQVAKKKQKQTQIKEIKFRPGTGEGDYQVKLRNLIRFLHRRGQDQSNHAFPRSRARPSGTGAGSCWSGSKEIWRSTARWSSNPRWKAVRW